MSVEKEVRDKIRKNCARIVEDLNLPRLLDYLFQDKLIDSTEFESLRDEYSRDKCNANRRFVTMFSGRGKPFDPSLLIRAFKKSDQEWLLL